MYTYTYIIKPTDTVDVALDRTRKIIINNEIDTFNVDTAGHELRTDQDPDFALAKALNDPVTLLLRSVGMNDIDIDIVEYQLIKQLFCALNGMYENEYWRSEPSFGN